MARTFSDGGLSHHHYDGCGVISVWNIVYFEAETPIREFIQTS